MNKIVWLTDLHLVGPGQDAPRGVDPLARLRACLAEIADRHADARRIVLTGDLIQLGQVSAYPVLRDELESLGLPYRLLAGNHDDRAALAESFDLATADGFAHAAEDLGGARLLYLDTVAAGGRHHGELCARRLEWVAAQFDASGDRPLLVFMHHPPCDIGVPALDALRLLDSEPLGDLLRARRSPTHVFCGHVHRNVGGWWAGHPFACLKSPHLQFDLDMHGPRLVRSAEPPGYGVILLGSEHIVVNFRDLPAD